MCVCVCVSVRTSARCTAVSQKFDFSVHKTAWIRGYLKNSFVRAPASATVEFEIGFSSELIEFLFLTHILCALTIHGYGGTIVNRNTPSRAGKQRSSITTYRVLILQASPDTALKPLCSANQLFEITDSGLLLVNHYDVISSPEGLIRPRGCTLRWAYTTSYRQERWIYFRDLWEISNHINDGSWLIVCREGPRHTEGSEC